MTKEKWIALALMGIGEALATEPNAPKIHIYYHDENPLPPVGKIAETKIRNELNESALFLYDKLDAEGKILVYQLCQQECKGQNECRGLNSCKSELKNSCAGRASCKGSANGNFEDKNLAVKVAVKKSFEERIERNSKIP